jgi:hypothetical protein
MTFREIQDIVFNAYIANDTSPVVDIIADIMFDDIDVRSMEEFGADTDLSWALENQGDFLPEALAWFKVVHSAFADTAGKFGM